MADSSIPPENAPPEAHVRLDGAVLCDSCGLLILKPTRGQRFCSGACRARASRTTKANRMRADLEELQRRLDAMIREL